MANQTLANPRLTAELTGHAFLDTLHVWNEATITNPALLGSKLIAELRARGLTLAPLHHDGIFRRDMTLKVVL